MNSNVAVICEENQELKTLNFIDVLLLLHTCFKSGEMELSSSLNHQSPEEPVLFNCSIKVVHSVRRTGPTVIFSAFVDSKRTLEASNTFLWVKGLCSFKDGILPMGLMEKQALPTKKMQLGCHGLSNDGDRASHSSLVFDCQNCSIVAVVSDGQIVESGSHDDLLGINISQCFT
ncbi:hypothetical protein OROHE_001211 [Orobanche hederae]